MKFGQTIEHNVRNTFLKSHAENEAGRLVTDLFLLYEKLYIRLVLIYFARLWLEYTTSKLWNICLTLIFVKGPGTSFSTTFSVWFFKKNISRMSHIFHVLEGAGPTLKRTLLKTFLSEVSEIFKTTNFFNNSLKNVQGDFF